MFFSCKRLGFMVLKNGCTRGLKALTNSSGLQNISLAPFKPKCKSYSYRVGVIRYTSNWFVTVVIGRIKMVFQEGEKRRYCCSGIFYRCSAKFYRCSGIFYRCNANNGKNYRCYGKMLRCNSKFSVATTKLSVATIKFTVATVFWSYPFAIPLQRYYLNPLTNKHAWETVNAVGVL